MNSSSESLPSLLTSSSSNDFMRYFRNSARVTSPFLPMSISTNHCGNGTGPEVWANAGRVTRAAAKRPEPKKRFIGGEPALREIAPQAAAVAYRVPGGRSREARVFLPAQFAVVVLVEFVSLAQLHIHKVVDRRHALTAPRFDLLAFGGFARQRALRDQAHLGLGDLVVAVSVVLVELGMDQRLGLGALDEAVAIGVEVPEFGPRPVLALLEGRPIGHVLREGRLGHLDELLDRELAVLVDVEFLERLHAVLQKLGARHLALLVGVDLNEPLRQRHGRRRAGGWRGRRWAGTPRRGARLRLCRRRGLSGLLRPGGRGSLV